MILLERTGDTMDLVTLPEKPVHAGGWGGCSKQPVGQQTISICFIFNCIVLIFVETRHGVKGELGWDLLINGKI